MDKLKFSAAQAQAILQFLSRAQITGAEAPAFMECVMVLRLIAAPPEPPAAPPAVDVRAAVGTQEV